MLSIIKKLCFFFQVYNSHFYLCSELKELKDEALSSKIQNYRERIFHRNQIYNDLNSITGIS